MAGFYLITGYLGYTHAAAQSVPILMFSLHVSQFRCFLIGVNSKKLHRVTVYQISSGPHGSVLYNQIPGCAAFALLILISSHKLHQPQLISQSSSRYKTKGVFTRVYKVHVGVAVTTSD